MLSLLALALSAWVKWKPVAGALLFGVFFVGAGFGAAVNGVLRTKWGHLLNISYLIGSVWVTLFEEPHEARRGRGLLPRVAEARTFRSGAAGRRWPASARSACGCWRRKIRGAEVVR